MPSKHKTSHSQPRNEKSQPVGESAGANESKMKPDANPQRAPSPPPDKQWREHEHHAPTTHAQAKQLLDEVGSPELAKHAVQQAHEHEEPQHETVAANDADKDAAARQVGYDSFAALIDDSTAYPGPRNRVTHVCELHDGRWIRFERESWPKFEAFQKRDQAIPPHAAPDLKS